MPWLSELLDWLYKWMAPSSEDEQAFQDRRSRAALHNEITKLSQENERLRGHVRNLEDEIPYWKEMANDWESISDVMHQRTALPSWTQLAEREDEVGERLRRIRERERERMIARESQNAE